MDTRSLSTASARVREPASVTVRLSAKDAQHVCRRRHASMTHAERYRLAGKDVCGAVGT